jgi:hypothetical protein
MAWCKVSSLSAAVSRTLKDAKYPLTRGQVLAASHGKNVEGWDIDYFLEKALKRRNYPDVRTVMADLNDWLEKQG